MADLSVEQFLAFDGKCYVNETTRVRARAHAAFDQLWKGPGACMRRRDAYAWMRRVMGLKPDDAHIALFEDLACEQLIALLKEHHGIE